MNMDRYYVEKIPAPKSRKYGYVLEWIKSKIIILIALTVLLITGFFFVQGILRDLGTLMVFCNWNALFAGFILLTRFKHPFLNGAYRMSFIFSFLSLIGAQESGFILDWVFVLLHFVHVIGLVFFIKNDRFRTSILGLCAGFIAILLYINAVWFIIYFLNISPSPGFIIFFGVTTIYFPVILFFVCAWFIVNGWLIYKQIKSKKSTMTFRELIDL